MSEPESPDFNLDELLREKGYLTSPVNRLVVHSVRSLLERGKGLMLLSLLSSLLCALLLGLLITAGEMITTPHLTLLLLPLYYLIPLTIGIFVLFLLLLAFLYLIFRIHPQAQPRGLSIVAGIIISLLSLLLLWLPLFTPAPWPCVNLLWILLFTIATFLLLTPSFRLLILLYTHPSPEQLRRSRSFLVPLILILLITMGILLAILSRSGHSGSHSVVTVTSLPPKTALLMIDGLPLELFQSSFQPDTPAVTVPVEDHHRAVPMVNWTEMMTGFPAKINGVRSLEVIQLPAIRPTLSHLPLKEIFILTGAGRKTLSTYRNRRCPTVWEWAASAGLSVNVVNTWSSWPPWSDKARVISNLALYRRLMNGKATAFQPPSLGDFVPQPPVGINRGFALDQMAWKSAQALEKQYPSNVLFLYLPGLDIFMHEKRTLDAAALSTRQSAMEEHLRFLREVITTLTGQTEHLILLLHPGRSSGKAPAIVFLSATIPADPTPLQSIRIAPTILRLLNLPLHSGMGTPLSPLPWPTAPLRHVTAFPTRESDYPSNPHPPLQELKSLGYLQ